MELKEIAVLTEFIDNYYCSDIIRGIKDYFKDKPARVSFLETRMPNAEASDFEYQYWGSALLSQADRLEAVIVISATYCTDISAENFSKLLEKLIKVPVISIAIPLTIKNSYYTIADCVSGYRELINHLIQEHGRKKIAFVSAEKTSSLEAAERLEAYKTILAENQMPFDPRLVIASDFTQNETINVFRKKFPTRDSIDFDAVVCVNDYSAFGTIYYLKELGYKIPEDIIVTGYDDCSFAQDMGLTSINQQIFMQGYEAARVAFEITQGKTPERKTKVAVKPLYRRSCGCHHKAVIETDKNSNFSTTQQFIDVSRNFESLYSLIDKMQGSHSLSDMYNLLARILIEANITSFAICLYKEPFFTSKGREYPLPEEASLTMHYDHHHMVMALNEDISFNPRERLLPEGILEDEPSVYILDSIFYGEQQFGYFMYRPGKKDFILYNVYMKMVSSSIAQAYLYSMKLAENSSLEKANKELSISSQTDELTKVFNRRGFLVLGQKTIDLALQMETKGLVLFGDMDGLKKINDTYGHDAGDRAIKAEAQILSKCFRGSDVIGRMGGDEFAIVASGMALSRLEELKKQIANECKVWETYTDSPFKLSISLGGVEFDSENCILENLIASADEVQYIEKKARHKSRE